MLRKNSITQGVSEPGAMRQVRQALPFKFVWTNINRKQEKSSGVYVGTKPLPYWFYIERGQHTSAGQK